MAVFNNILAGASGATGAAAGFKIDRSLRFNSADSAYLNRTPSSAGNRKTWTWAGWVKRNAISSGTGQNIFVGSDNPTKNNTTHSAFYFHPSDKLYFGGWNSVYIITDAVYRDPSAWYHIVLTVDTNQSTATDRIKVYVNNVLQTYSQGAGFPGQSTDLGINQTYAHYIGGNDPQSGYASHMYADIHFIDGQALAPTDFGEYDDNNAWQPKAYAGTYGTNGFKLDFSDNTSTTTIAEDSSGNNNDFTANNISVASGAGNDSLFDAPTNGSQSDTGAGGEVSGNYATWSPLVAQTSGSITFSNGNLDTTCGSTRTTAMSSFPLTGKTYWEVTFGSGTYNYIGMTEATGFNTVANNNSGIKYTGYQSYSYGWSSGDGNLYKASNILSSSPGTYSNGDVMGWAYDADNNTLKLYKNGTLQHTETGIADAQYFPAITHSGTATASTNFGQRAFAYSAPSGYKALCTANLPDPTIADGSTAMDVVTYTGDGNTTRTISGLEFAPDLVWLKTRNNTGGDFSHRLFDTVRGINLGLSSNSTNAEENRYTATCGGVHAFNSDGFTLSQSSGNVPCHNASNNSMVAWSWDAGSSTVSNTDGSITSNVRANASAGFSIVSYTGNGTVGATVGHGLNAAPELVISKNRDVAGSWNVIAPEVLGAGYWMPLHGTDAASLYNSAWTTSSSVITLADGNGHNANGDNIIAYCFAPVEGYSAFGSYTGNGSSDGPFVYTGFRPAFILFKITSALDDWIIFDTARDTYNRADKELYPNLNKAEEDNDRGSDILSNGFKIRTTASKWNTSGATYIYAAFAEHPFKTARAR